MTLVEMIVVLAILGLAFSVSGLALASLQAPRESEWIAQLRAARRRAIHTGLPVRLQLAQPLDRRLSDRRLSDRRLLDRRSIDRRFTVLFLPDGRGVGIGVDQLTGVPRDSTR